MNLCAWIDQRAELVPENIALEFQGRLYSWSDIADDVARLAAVLKQSFEVGEGDRVAWHGNNHPQILVLLFACARLGAILVPLNWRLAIPELVTILDDAEVQLLVVGQDQQQSAIEITRQLPHCKPVHAGQVPSNGPGWPALQVLKDACKTGCHDNTGAADVPVLILYTSGTTGKPKGVVLTQEALCWSARNSVAMHGLTDKDHVLTVLPLFHAGGFNIQTLPALSVGACVTLHESFDPGAVLADIGSGRITLVGLVPAHIGAMLMHPDWSVTELSHLRCVTTGSTFVPDSCLAAWEQRAVTAIQVYGTTETCVVAIHQNCENAASSRGTAGYAAEHCKVKIIDDNGHEVSAREHGEILVKGPSVFQEYWCNPVATEQSLQDGWFHTGDIGFQREDGAYVISDRKADRIISGGENIYPAELETILDEHPEIIETAVIGLADERWGEVPIAFVVTASGSELDGESVKAMFENRLAHFKHPQRVMLVDQLPRNAMGKIEKFELRKQIMGTITQDRES